MKVGDTIEYYVPEAAVGDLFNICQGIVTTILPNDSLQVMTDVHCYIDGLIRITYGQPIVLSRLDMYHTKVLVYRTMVLLVRLTKVRR